MCDLEQGFRLCSCEDQELSDPSWILERRDESIPESHRRGRAFTPTYSADEAGQRDLIVHELNGGAPFDFEYEPRAGDVLSIRVRECWFRFRYGDLGWSPDTSTSLEGWRAQMVRVRTGGVS